MDVSPVRGTLAAGTQRNVTRKGYTVTPTRKPVNMRLPEELIGRVDDYAADNGMSRTSAAENLIRTGLEAAEKPPTASVNASDTDDTQPEYKAVIDVLRESNADLRKHASQLYAQLGAKDEQIRSLQLIVNQSQQLEMGRLAASAKDGSPETLRARIRRLFGMNGGDTHE